MNCELPHVHDRFRKGIGTRDQIANIHWIIEKAREFQKSSTTASQTIIIFLGSKITADGDCSHKIKRYLLAPWKKNYDKYSVSKSRDITSSTKIHVVKAMVFPVFMYGCESWAIKKAECCKVDALVLWCQRKLLSILWTARRSNQSILKEINPEYAF